LCGAKIQLLSAIFEKLNGNDSNTNKVRAYFFSPGESNNKDCGDECFSEAGNYGERFEKLKTFYKQSGNVKINVKGDNRLWRLSQDRQRLLMLWTEVRSIYDVLQSWHGTEIMKKNDKLKHGNAIYFVDSFSKNSSWKWDFTKVDDGSIIFGTDSSKIEAAFGPVKYTVPFQDRHENRGDIDRKWVSYKSLDRLWGVSYGVDNMTFGDSQNRKLLTFETIFARKSSKEWYSENWALTGGIQAYSGFGPDGLALTTRLLYVLPATETALSVQLRGLRLSRRDAPALWKPTIGGRVDFGFTSFMTSYLQFGRDFALQKDNGVRSGWSIGAGIQLVAPTCRIPLIKNLGSCD
jgi:hypothetical protein